VPVEERRDDQDEDAVSVKSKKNQLKTFKEGRLTLHCQD